MPRVLRMPEVTANATHAVVAEWTVTENAPFAAMDAIATVETEKALVDVEADEAGVVLKTLVTAGSEVEVGAPIAVLGAPGEVITDAILAELGITTGAVDTAVGAGPEVSSVSGNGRVFASPLARKLAKEAAIPVEAIPGSGPRGRILRRDVDAAVAALSIATAPPPVPAPAPEPELKVERRTPSGSTGIREPVAAALTDIPHTRQRRAIAHRLVGSKQEVPHFYLRATVDVGRLLALRQEINQGATARISVNDLLVRAVALAHLEVPEMNVVWAPDSVRRFETVDIAVAIATDRGLVTPVLRDVAALPVTAVAARLRDLADRARGGKLKQEELEGGTISVTNLGMHGVEEFAAIINPPHAAILAIGTICDKPVVRDALVVPGKLLTVTLSVDHRPLDGVVAARWLAAYTRLLEAPAQILV